MDIIIKRGKLPRKLKKKYKKEQKYYIECTVFNEEETEFEAENKNKAIQTKAEKTVVNKISKYMNELREKGFIEISNK